MSINEVRSSFHHSPRTYFQKALKLFEAQDIPAGLQSLDAAIVFSNNSPFYLHQKIRILYRLGALKNCSDFIVSQLEYLYKYGSLYILCRTIDYLQLINHYTTGQLQSILDQNHIPFCIANHYKDWLITRNKPFYDFAKQAFLQDHYSLCIAYCLVFLKYEKRRKDIIYYLAYSYHMTGNITAAKPLYLEYYKATHHNSEAGFEVACVLMDAGCYDEAASLLNELLLTDSKNYAYLSCLSECYYLKNKLNASIQLCKSIAKYYPNDVQNLFNLSHAYSRQRKKWHVKRCSKQISKLLKQNINH